MPLAKRMLRGDAVYWAPGPADGFGRPTYASAVPMKCRWTDEGMEFTAANGTKQISKAEVFCEFTVALGGFLWKGVISDLVSTDTPLDNPGAYKIEKYEEIESLRYNPNKKVRIATL